MYYARILNNTVKNVIVLDDPALISDFSVGYDLLVNVTDLLFIPGPFWTYNPNDGTFSPPSET